MIFRHTLPTFIRDLKRFTGMNKTRQSHFDTAPDTTPVGVYGANTQSASLHPDVQTMCFMGLTEENNILSATLSGDAAAYFRAGQSVNLITGNAVIPCFLLSSPSLSSEGGYVIDLSDKTAAEYFRTLEKGAYVTVSQPVGTFFYQPLRDGNKVSVIAEETATHIALYLKNEIEKDNEGVSVSVGLCDNSTAVYVVGTHAFCDKQPDFIDGKKVRKLLTDCPERQAEHKEYSCRIFCGETETAIPVYSDEVLESSFEKHGIGTRVKCRDGECGFCRARLVSGNVTSVDVSPCGGRRVADESFGYIHPCRCFPDSDITVKF